MRTEREGEVGPRGEQLLGLSVAQYAELAGDALGDRTVCVAGTDYHVLFQCRRWPVVQRRVPV